MIAGGTTIENFVRYRPRKISKSGFPVGHYLNQTTIPAILYVGIFASLCAFVLWNKAIVVLGPSKAGMVYYTLPLFSGFLGYFFLHESIRMIHFYSMILIFSGIIVTNHEPKNPSLTPLKSGKSES